MTIKTCVKLYTDEERHVIEKCLREGRTYTEISQIIGRTRPSIKNEVQKNGGRPNYKAVEAIETAKVRAANRCKKPYPSEEAVRVVLQHFPKGTPYSEIMALANIGRQRLLKILRDNPQLERPHSKVEDEDREALKGLQNRLTALEMQVQILTDLIKELSKK